jgi:hypothetical protein
MADLLQKKYAEIGSRFDVTFGSSSGLPGSAGEGELERVKREQESCRKMLEDLICFEKELAKHQEFVNEREKTMAVIRDHLRERDTMAGIRENLRYLKSRLERLGEDLEFEGGPLRGLLRAPEVEESTSLSD